MITHNNRELMTIEELSEYLPEKPTKSAIYQWIWSNRIPSEKFGRRLYFDRALIDKWDKKGRPFVNEL